MTKEERLGQEPLGRLMFSLALPAVAAQLINVLYNIIDRIYIGHIEGYGDLALTGVGITFPIITIISAFSAFAGMGGAPLASIELGKHDYKRAERILGNSAGLMVFFSACLMIFCYLFKRPMLYAFGASDATIVYADSYLSIYLLGTLFVQFSIGLNTFISGQGAARTAMCSVLIGAITNICLDPVFIFLFNMGVRGAALATIISQGISAAWILFFLTSQKSIIRLRLSNMKLQSNMVGKIAALGISPFIMQSTESLVSITQNAGLQHYGGDLYVGSLSIIVSVMQLIMVPTHGITQGIQPIISYNYGAGNKERVRGAFYRMIAAALFMTLCFSTIAILRPRIYAGLFTNNENLVALTCSVMPVYFAGFTIFGIQAACQATFLALGQAKVSLFIALLRKVILLIPLTLILPRSLGVMGIYVAEPISDILSIMTTLILFFITTRKILREM